MEENGESVMTGCRENVRVALVYFPKNMNAFYEGSEQVRFVWNEVEENGESVRTGCRENVQVALV